MNGLNDEQGEASTSNRTHIRNINTGTHTIPPTSSFYNYDTLRLSLLLHSSHLVFDCPKRICKQNTVSIVLHFLLMGQVMIP